MDRNPKPPQQPERNEISKEEEAPRAEVPRNGDPQQPGPAGTSTQMRELRSGQLPNGSNEDETLGIP